ncbi:hypothetical protein [Gordonia sp. (in: high G+C Gram-positive bacteria)]|uniref:hypothetical protein n=1 Tax=Gordonia sp. (in: high G+C Gram-positive bacteria) TaxID=84139 RepID=UPI003F9D2EC1
MALNDWQDGAVGGTPLTAARLNERDTAIVDAGKTATWGQVSNKPSTFPPATHSHDVADVTGLQAILDDYETRIAALEAAAE